MYIIQSQKNAIKWARAIASKSSLTAINSSPVSSVFFPPRGLLHFDMYISRGFSSVPRFHNIKPFVLELPDPLLASNHFFIS